MAASLTDFLDAWSALAFAGPEDWMLMPLVGVGAGLDPTSPVAQAWQGALGLPRTAG